MSERNYSRKYDPFKDPRNNLRGMDREELEEWRQWAKEWKTAEGRKATLNEKDGRSNLAMHAFLDKKFINLVSSQLERFKWQRATLANCRCPLCGDSQKNKNKCRGYFYERDGTILLQVSQLWCSLIRVLDFLKR